MSTDCGHGPTPNTCAAERQRRDMIDTGRAVLYLPGDPRLSWRVRDWTNFMSFRVVRYNISRHNMAGRRVDVWFPGPDGYVWHGYRVGQNTEICHCRRTQERAAIAV